MLAGHPGDFLYLVNHALDIRMTQARFTTPGIRTRATGGQYPARLSESVSVEYCKN